MPHKKPQSQPETTRQQQGGAQPHGGSGKSRQQVQESPRERDPHEHDQDVQERAPEGDVETGRGGRSPQVEIDRE